MVVGRLHFPKGYWTEGSLLDITRSHWKSLANMAACFIKTNNGLLASQRDHNLLLITKVTSPQCYYILLVRSKLLKGERIYKTRTVKRWRSLKAMSEAVYHSQWIPLPFLYASICMYYYIHIVNI